MLKALALTWRFFDKAVTVCVTPHDCVAFTSHNASLLLPFFLLCFHSHKTPSENPQLQDKGISSTIEIVLKLPRV
jgi:hypothetical protein